MDESSVERPPRRPSGAVRELYDTFVRAALQRFFDDASLTRQPFPSSRPGSHPYVEPPADPSKLAIQWLGWRYVLTARPGRAFTENDVRLASAISLALAARYRAVLDPLIMAERGDLFHGAVEDRFVGAFLDPRPYAPDASPQVIDHVAPALDVLRVAAVSSYENRPISTGLLLLGTPHDPASRRSPAATASPFWDVLTNVKGLFRLANGVETLFLVGSDDRVVDVIDIARWVEQRVGRRALTVPCAQAYVPHALSTIDGPHVCVVLSPSHEMKVFAEGAQLFTFRNAEWHLLDLEARFEQWAAAIGSRPLADRLFRTALDLSDAREGALFVVLREPLRDASRLIAAGDRLDLESPPTLSEALSARRQILRLLAGRSILDLDASVLAALAPVDGAIVTDPAGVLLAAGAILRHPPEADGDDRSWVAEGARTTAALAASQFGPVLKVSEDGVITFFDRGETWDI